MGETANLVSLWRRARERGEEVCLATVVNVEGSSYRKPGARMLLTSGGERVGTISGGCLEAEISRRAWWLTESGSTIQKFESSLDEDGSGPRYGLGCGGIIAVLLERDPHEVLSALAASLEEGVASVVLHRILSSAGPVGSTVIRTASLDYTDAANTYRKVVAQAWAEHASCWLYNETGSLRIESSLLGTGEAPIAWAEFLKSPPRLTILGAGQDAEPLARFTDEIGWRVRVADGRKHLLRAERFPSNVELVPLEYVNPHTRNTTTPGCLCNGELPKIPNVQLDIRAGEFAVILTHSYEQDRALLHALLPARLRYLGILGPRHRTAQLIEEVAPSLGWSAEQCWSGLYSPVGLDLGTRDPASIALAIAAELQATAALRHVTVSRSPGASLVKE